MKPSDKGLNWRKKLSKKYKKKSNSSQKNKDRIGYENNNSKTHK